IFYKRQKHFFGYHKVWSQFMYNSPFQSHFFYQPKIKLFEVPEAAMNKFSGLTTGSRSKIAFFNQSNLHTTGRSIKQDSRTRNSTANNHQVKLSFFKLSGDFFSF